jgi:signal transduction histidine kinase
MGHSFPSSWEKISAFRAGQFFTPEGLFTFTTIYPLLEGWKSSTGAEKAFMPSKRMKQAREYFWKIVSYVPRENVNEELTMTFIKSLLISIVISLIMGTVAWLLSTAKVKHDVDDWNISKHSEELEEETKKLEESEKALTCSLEDVNEARSNLEKANIKLKELDQLKSMFVASMSHELRTPLNSIIGFTGIILQGIDGEINPQQKDHLGRVNRSGKHLLALINDVIDISKIEAGKIDVFVEDFVLDEVINEAVDGVRLQANEKRLALDVSVPPGVRMTTDRKRLYQCILNYLSNAVKFTETGTISVTAHETSAGVEVIVSDTGIGISKEDQQRLFKPFEQIDSHLRIKTLGTGLGLYLTKKLTTEVLGGTVDVQSQPGKGSTFTLRLPRVIKKV